MTGPSYTFPLRVRLYDLDLREEVSCATLLRFFEETAMQASSHLGFTLDWYNERGQFWVIRTMRLERNGAAKYEDDLEIRTWVSAMTRVRADRNYMVRRVRDGRVLARATANWVYLDRRKLYPARIAPDIVAMFTNSEPAALPSREDREFVSGPDQDIQARIVRRASYFEADSARHTNNAVYIDWIEEAVRDTLSMHGYPLVLDSGPFLWFHSHSIEYMNPALPGDELEIMTRLVGQGKSVGRWQIEIRRIASGEVVARARCATIWVDYSAHPARWSEAHRKSDKHDLAGFAGVH